MLKYPHIFEPIELAGTIFRNRIFAAPTGYMDEYQDGTLPPEAAAYFARKARGGAAAVTMGECQVDTDYGVPSHQIKLDDPFHANGLIRCADEIRRYGAVASVELQHAGMFSNRQSGLKGEASRGLAYGPVDCEDNGRIVLAMDEARIERTIRKYAQAAAFAKRCGFGMVTVHAGHGWLMSQFLSPTLNTRKDRWGGPDIENRARLLVSVLEAIRQAVGPRFPIEVRISGSECYAGGYDIEEGIRIAKQIDGLCDLIHVSAGSHEVAEVFTVTHPSMFLPDGCNAIYAEAIKKHVSTPVATVGAHGNPEIMEELVASGKVDVVEIARGLMADPDLVNKLRAGQDGEVRKCMRCLACFSGLLRTGQFHCAINPEIGRETEYAVPDPMKKQKTVLVAGGGVGGMQAALTAAERGHKVILCEKAGELGGAIRCERNVPFKAKLDEYLNQQAFRLARAGVDVRLNTEVTHDLAESLRPDVIIAATGAVPVKPAIPGIDGPNVCSAEYAYTHPEACGRKVVILGAGLVGIELGIYLAMQGREVELVEMLDHVSDGGNMLHMRALNVEIARYGIGINLSTRAEEITSQGVIGNGKLFPADTVVYAVGQQPRRQAATALYDCAPEFYLLGDCIAPANIMNATSAADAVARAI